MLKYGGRGFQAQEISRAKDRWREQSEISGDQLGWSIVSERERAGRRSFRNGPRLRSQGLL